MSMDPFTKNTGNRLEGFNSPRCDKPKLKSMDPKDYAPAFGPPPKQRKSRSARAACIETLLKYRTYVSHNDVALHHRYKAAMLHSGIIDSTWQLDYQPWQQQVYYKCFYASMFRECLYTDMFLLAEKQINNFKRGEYVAIVEQSFLYLIITPITFHLDVSLKRVTDLGVF